jgi:membrane protease YdiL (CAAX protease family)
LAEEPAVFSQSAPVNLLTGSKAMQINENSDRYKEKSYELAVFLFLIIPSMLLSFFLIRGQKNQSFVLTAIFTMLRDLGLVNLLLFFLWRNGESWERLGWNFKNGWKDVVLGSVLFVPTFLIAGLLDSYLQAAGFSTPKNPMPAFLEARGGAELALAFFLVIIVAIAEETIFRGYLLLRFQEVRLTSSTAVLWSALIFSLGHGYEGASGVVTVGFMGAVFALVYFWRGSLVAPMVMHFLQDFIGIVLAPWLGLK